MKELNNLAHDHPGRCRDYPGVSFESPWAMGDVSVHLREVSFVTNGVRGLVPDPSGMKINKLGLDVPSVQSVSGWERPGSKW